MTDGCILIVNEKVDKCTAECPVLPPNCEIEVKGIYAKCRMGYCWSRNSQGKHGSYDVSSYFKVEEIIEKW